MSKIFIPEKPKIKLIDMPIANPKTFEVYREKAIAAEPTGKGNTLIIDLYFGRMFRSDIGCVDDELDEFIRQYHDMCRRLDEDPAGEYYDVLSYNDLYYLHGIIPGVAQGRWGWTNTHDYRVDPLEFKRKYVDGNDEWYDLFGEPYYCYCPDDRCEPDPCYMEV